MPPVKMALDLCVDWVGGRVVDECGVGVGVGVTTLLGFSLGSTTFCCVSCGVRAHTQLPAVDLKSTPLATQAN